ncbi:hypothetical protein ACP70R_022512 [Stipagrostis hirtigluma subsp. patula]
MAQRNQGTMATSLPKRKDVVNGASTTVIRQSEESNSVVNNGNTIGLLCSFGKKVVMLSSKEKGFSFTILIQMSGMEALSRQEMNGKAVQQKETLTNQMEATMKQEPRKEKRKKQKTMQSPILAAVLKFHKDDDMDPPRPPATGDAVAAA